MLKIAFLALTVLSLTASVETECFCNERKHEAVCQYFSDVVQCDFPVVDVMYLEKSTTRFIPVPPIVVNFEYDPEIGWKIGLGVGLPGGVFVLVIGFIFYRRRQNQQNPLWPILGRVTRPSTARPSIGLPNLGLAMVSVGRPAISRQAIPLPPPSSIQVIPPAPNALVAQAIPPVPALLVAQALPAVSIASMHVQAATALQAPQPAAGVGPGPAAPKVPPQRPPWR